LDYGLKSSFPVTERATAQSSAPPLAQGCVVITADRSTAQEETRWWWVSLLRTAWRTWGVHALALADQAVVSAASFLTTVIIARWTFPNELGLYSIGISLLVSSLSIQESLISLPYTIQQHRAPASAAEHAGSSLTHSVLLSAFGIVVLAVTALALSANGAEPQFRAMTWTLAGVLPFAFLREFARKFSLAHLQPGQALILDSAVAAIQLAGLGWIGWTGWMSNVTACAALGVACALAAIPWLCFSRRKFVIRWDWDQVLTTTRQSWGLGKWLFAGQITVSLQGYMVYWLLAMVAGTAATGVFAACMSVVMFANPLITGFTNIMTPRAVSALKEGGGALLRRQMIRDGLLLSAAMTAFCVVVLFFGDDVMGLLYPGKQYEGQGHTVTVLAVALLASAVGTPASVALASMERPRAIVWAGSVGVVITGVLVWLLMVEWNLAGAAYGFLCGNLAAAVGRWVAFLTLVSDRETRRDPLGRQSDSASLGGVLQHFTQSGKDADWVIKTLGEGDQANVHSVRSQSRQRIWQTHRTLVIKLYKPELTPKVEAVRRQFEALSRLRVVLHGHTINGWKISTPAPLYVCVSPLALVMTMVPGRPLTSLLDDADNMTPEVLDSVPRAVAAAMERCWSVGQLHGDLNFDNILCDIANRALSFVDLGPPTNSLPLCDDVPRRWYPASHDLAYMLYDTGMRVKSTLGNPKARLRQQLFAESTLRAFIETIGPFEEKQRLLDEIEACTRVFLKSLCPSSPRELWRMIVKKIAARRIEAILLRLKAQSSHLDGNQLRNSETM
jgi:O-antigen/teichoic acid export membrane protein